MHSVVLPFKKKLKGFLRLMQSLMPKGGKQVQRQSLSSQNWEFKNIYFLSHIFQIFQIKQNEHHRATNRQSVGSTRRNLVAFVGSMVGRIFVFGQLLNANQNVFQNQFQKGQPQQPDQFSTIQYTTLSMYPFYYPFATPYSYNPYPSYPYDFNNSQPLFEMAHCFTLEENREKNEEVNTSYSVKGPVAQQKHSPKAATNQFHQPDFPLPKEPAPRSEKRNEKKDEEQFRIKSKSVVKDQGQRMRYVNKNFESNIINKIFAFLWSEDKSKMFVNKILKDKTKTLLYFDYIKIIRKYCKRYINKEYLQDLCDYQPQHIAYRIVARNGEKLKYFSMQDLSQTIRKLIFIYLREVCSVSILTSKKMRVDIWKDHLEKSRNIYEFLFEGLLSEQYELRMSQSYDTIYVSGKGK